MVQMHFELVQPLMSFCAALSFAARPTQVGEFLNQVKWFTVCYNWCVLNGINARNLGVVGVVCQGSLLGISAETVGLLRNVLQREQQGSRQSWGLKVGKWVSTLMPLAPSAVVLRMIQSVATRMIIEVMTDFCWPPDSTENQSDRFPSTLDR